MTDLDSFIRLARRGAFPGCSGGERRAAELARCMVDNACGLDAYAAHGAAAFLLFAHQQPAGARDQLDAVGLSLPTQAEG